jgi:hypothetical protein
MKLSGQEYVDEYAQRAKVRLADRLRHDGHGRLKAEDSEPGPDERESRAPDQSEDSQNEHRRGDQSQQVGEPERVGAAEADDD